MKRNAVTVIVGVLLLLIFVLLLFTFQVRQTEIAVVTTFDNPTRYIEEPGFKWKWPRPIQKVYKFDKRVQNFEGRYEQTLTRDNYNLMLMVYAGWTIEDPQKFFNSFPSGTVEAAEASLESLITSAKNIVVGQHPFSHFVSTDPQELQFGEIETQILEAAKPVALESYGVALQFLGIKRLGLPESVTQKVFDRMKAERESQVANLRAQGEAAAIGIRSAADQLRDEAIARAQARARAIEGEADAEAQRYYQILQEDPELAIFLRNLRALEEGLKQATLIVDERVYPFGLLFDRPQPRAGERPTQPAPTQLPAPAEPEPSEEASASAGESDTEAKAN